MSQAALGKVFGLIPAAGSGSRMGADVPKQYLSLLGRPMIAHSIAAMLSDERVARVAVVLAPDDSVWDQHDWQMFGQRLQVLRCGGETRADSVANGLAAMDIVDMDWVLVHDAARPCLDHSSLASLIDTLMDDPVGGILAVPVADTLKRADICGRISQTVDRAGLWQAQTPQMFRRGMLQLALASRHAGTTDEASAIEALGFVPALVAAPAANFKVTYPDDLALAALVLAARSHDEGALA